MHLAAGRVTVFFRVPLSRSKTLCDSELQDMAKVCVGGCVFSGAVEFGKLLIHNECREVDQCVREKLVSHTIRYIDTAKRVLRDANTAPPALSGMCIVWRVLKTEYS